MNLFYLVISVKSLAWAIKSTFPEEIQQETSSRVKRDTGATWRCRPNNVHITNPYHNKKLICWYNKPYSSRLDYLGLSFHAISECNTCPKKKEMCTFKTTSYKSPGNLVTNPEYNLDDVPFTMIDRMTFGTHVLDPMYRVVEQLTFNNLTYTVRGGMSVRKVFRSTYHQREGQMIRCFVDEKVPFPVYSELPDYCQRQEYVYKLPILYKDNVLGDFDFEQC